MHGRRESRHERDAAGGFIAEGSARHRIVMSVKERREAIPDGSWLPRQPADTSVNYEE